MAQNTYYVYILASKPFGTLYVGVTNDIARRIYEHKNEPAGFVKKYKINMLVYLEEFYEVREAINFEKKLKRWNRTWKIALIAKHNPTWLDLVVH